jgi:hypothetical protein
MAPLTTSMPPQSPVAWSNIAVGGTPAIHGIYDFIHRDPATMSPFLSMSRVTPSARVLHLGEYAIPLSAGKTENLQQGKPFWAYLAEREIPTTLFKMPANFPCRGRDLEMISGMGTPDLRADTEILRCLPLARNHFRRTFQAAALFPFTFRAARSVCIYPDRRILENGCAGSGDSDQRLARPHQFGCACCHSGSRVCPPRRGMDRLVSGGISDDRFISQCEGICKIYIKSVHPHFSMYVSPINIDPSEPALPIVSSEKYGKLLAEENGFFYTQGLPEDTKALSEGIFSDDEYLELARQVMEERKKLLFFEFERFNRRESGMLFFYVSSIDQNSHMYWRAIDPRHPQYSPELSGHYGDILADITSRLMDSWGRF